MELNKEVKKSLLEHYSNETCSHIEAAISLFFGLIGNLILLAVVTSLAARVVFSIMYFALGGLAVYFYIRLFYYRKLLEGILLDDPFKAYHIRLEGRVFKKSKLIKWTWQISRRGKGDYRMSWAWFMLTLAVAVAILSWIIVVLSI